MKRSMNSSALNDSEKSLGKAPNTQLSTLKEKSSVIMTKHYHC